jgi:hypothetical protein
LNRYEKKKIELKVSNALGKFKPRGFLEVCGVGDSSISVITLDTSDLIDVVAEMAASKEEKRVRKALDVLVE